MTDIHPDLTEEDLKQGTVIITEQDNHTVEGESFESRVPEIVTSEREKMELGDGDAGGANRTVRVPGDLSTATTYVDQRHNVGVYNSRMAMVIHGHQWVERVYADELETFQSEESILTALNRSRAEQQIYNTRCGRMAWADGNVDSRVTFKLSDMTWQAMEKTSTAMNMKLSAYYRHCMIVSYLSLGQTAIDLDGHEKYTRWVRQLDEYITETLPMFYKSE